MICDLCGTPLERADSKRLRCCAECRLIIANENTESLSDRRQRVVAEKIAQLGHNTKEEHAGFTEFRLLEAWHRETRCEHWICLKCASTTIRRWTREAGLTYKPESGA